MVCNDEKIGDDEKTGDDRKGSTTAMTIEGLCDESPISSPLASSGAVF